MKSVALLLDDDENRYQQLLVREAKAAAARLRLALLDPEFARGSSWTQVESINAHLRRGSDRPDAMLVILAGNQLTRAPFERVVKAGVALVFLNRIPSWTEELRRLFPKALVAGATPRQEGIGEIQAQQAARLARAGAFVILVTGAAASPAAIERKQGFLGEAGARFSVHDVDGRWSAEGAEKALAEWFRLGAERDHAIDLVVCQNDAMARGARTALLAQAASAGRRELEGVPLIGCDGIEEEGQAMVARRELVATVVMPPTTPAALEIVSRYLDSGARSETVSLDATSFPPLEKIASR